MPVIERSGGRCLANAQVTNIIFHTSTKTGKKRAIGVEFCHPNNPNKKYPVHCKKGVISGIGFPNTFNKIISLDKMRNDFGNNYVNTMKRLLTNVPHSTQHFTCFVGFNKSAKELGFPQHNRWIFRFDDKTMINKTYDYDEILENYGRDPMNAPVIGFIGFASAKDPSYNLKFGENKAMCLVLTEINGKLFSKYKNSKPGARGKEYNDLKRQIGTRLLDELLWKDFPDAKEYLSKIEYGTALSGEHYLGSYYGESFGIQTNSERYFDFDLARIQFPKTPINGFYLTGQDVLAPGWASSMNAGLMCAENILGYQKWSVLLSGRSLKKDLAKLDGIE